MSKTSYIVLLLLSVCLGQQGDLSLAKEVIGKVMTADGYEIKVTYELYSDSLAASPIEILPYHVSRRGNNFYTSSTGVMDYIINENYIYLIDHKSEYILVANRKNADQYSSTAPGSFYNDLDSLLKTGSLNYIVEDSDSVQTISYYYTEGRYAYSSFFFSKSNKQLVKAIYKYRFPINGVSFIMIKYDSFVFLEIKEPDDFPVLDFLTEKNKVVVPTSRYTSYKLYDLRSQH